MDSLTGRHCGLTLAAVCCCVVSSLILPGVVTATIWHVPTDPGAATIAEALANAQPEDRVLVAPGTYHEQDLEIPHGVYFFLTEDTAR
jgi:hypothetical protein